MRAPWAKGLREYQLDAAEWLQHPPNRGRLLALRPGLGKTACAIAALRIRFDAGQLDSSVPIITTAIARSDWLREAKRWWPEARVHIMRVDEPEYRKKGEEFPSFRARRRASWVNALKGGGEKPTLLVASYEAVRDLHDASIEHELLFDTCVWDECFTGETQVWTLNGRVPISHLKVGATVVGVGPHGLTEEQVTHVFEKRVSHSLVLELGGGHKVKTTENHPFLTSTGWVQAGELHVGDQIVRVVHDAACEGLPWELRDQKVLWQELLGQMANATASGSSGSLQPASLGQAESITNRLLQERPFTCQSNLGPHDREEPNAETGNALEGVGCSSSDGAPSTSGREWQTSSTTPAEVSFRTGVGDGVCSFDGDQASWIPHQLQVGHRQSDDQGGGGGRWILPWDVDSAGTGQEKSSVPGSLGLARVEGIQRRRLDENSSDRRVYNLEVSGASTYVVANGLVVHNCHGAKRAQNITSVLLRTLVSKSRTNFLLTGTPVHNRPHDLFNLLQIMDPLEFPTFMRWASKFFMVRSHRFGQSVDELLDKPGLNRFLSPYFFDVPPEVALGALPPRQRYLRRIPVKEAVRISPAKLNGLKSGSGLDKALRAMVRHKMRAAVDLCRDLDEPIVCYTYKKCDARELVKKLRALEIPTTLAMGTGEEGGTPPEKRAELIELWKQGLSRVLVCTMDAVRESATLTHAACMIFLDLDWLPGKMLQLEGRIDPSRQPVGERRPVRYYYLMVEGGADEVVAERVIQKITEAQGIIGAPDAGTEALKTMLSVVKRTPDVPPSEMLADLVGHMEARAARLEEVGMFDLDWSPEEP